TLSAVLEHRRSLRRYGAPPIQRRQLGELLFRSARIVDRVATDEGGLTRRPYPSGGALHALEIYPLVVNCVSLAPALWRYLPGPHALAPVAPPGHKLERLLEDARQALQATERPQVLLIVTARFARVAWKYESLAYALLLKELGALLQTLYLVATDMDLAPCAIGSGDSDVFAQAAGLDYLVEGAIGEMAVGSRASAPETGETW
ncbi:MAG TPA: SagB family peptide dehydrogenase, partial [Thermoanaerobaculia bacterium]|nr:SagB family peptide dehydrogenase [Thermoanaerobaculia bacterium]